MIKLFLFIFIFNFGLSEAGLKEDMLDFYERCGSSHNSTSGEIYQGQKAGYATGGGVVIRNRVESLKPMTVSLPKIDAGCGGIDIYTGGMSFINEEQLVNTLKSIGSSTASYAFLLARVYHGKPPKMIHLFEC